MNKHGLYFPIVIQDGSPVPPKLGDSISASIRHILSYNPGTRPFLPAFGGGLETFLGSPLTSRNLDIIRVQCLLAINKWERRMDINSVTLDGTDPVNFTVNATVPEFKQTFNFEFSL
jgi:phage baseplate assembly protein W